MRLCLKRFAALCLALALFTTAAAAAGAKGSTYSDVPQRHWAAGSIEQCTKLGLMQGVGKGKFGLGQTMTRAQYAMALCRLMGWEMVSPEKGSFADNQDKNRWYYSAIETAYANGALVNESMNCRPTDPITREEMAKMTIRALGYGMLTGTASGRCPFEDVSVARGYVALAYEMGIIKGVNEKTFSPKGKTTREQAAAVLQRTYDRLHAAVTVKEAASAPSGAAAAESVTGSGRVPVSPRAPLANVYTAALSAAGGTVAINAVPFEQTVYDGKTQKERTLTEKELDEFLAQSGTVSYYSEQHKSSCAYRSEKNGTVVTVWYESEADIAEKVTLCRMLGVKTVYVLK